MIGTLFCVLDHERYDRFALAFHLGLGWCIVLAAWPLYQRIGSTGLMLIVAGGLSYTIGVAFYIRERLRYSHAIWRLFVLAGSTLHYFAVLSYVLPEPASA